jgi:2-polyprenyl-3-methyl-5-hydroxy-6-metoxy-1,4-benzoquinol methylase
VNLVSECRRVGVSVWGFYTDTPKHQHSDNMPLLSDIARRKKVCYFLDPIPKDARVLEIGCGSKWVGEYLRANGWTHYTGMDLFPPADVVGDIKKWRELGLQPESFDVIIAFEVIEHVDCFQECHDLLRPGGLLMLTSPVPHMDWAMKTLEVLGLNQKRTSPHSNLTYFTKIPKFEPVELKTKAGLAQWGILRKPAARSSA